MLSRFYLLLTFWGQSERPIKIGMMWDGSINRPLSAISSRRASHQTVFDCLGSLSGFGSHGGGSSLKFFDTGRDCFDFGQGIHWSCWSEYIFSWFKNSGNFMPIFSSSLLNLRAPTVESHSNDNFSFELELPAFLFTSTKIEELQKEDGCKIGHSHLIETLHLNRTPL